MNLNNSSAVIKKKIEAKVERILKSEVAKLEGITKSVYQQYLKSYSPTQYVRTGEMIGSIGKTEIVKEGNKMKMAVSFDNSSAYHESLFGGSKGHAPILISEGWHSKRLEQTRMGRVYRLTYYEGFDALGKIESQYEAVKNPLARLEIQRKR